MPSRVRIVRLLMGFGTAFVIVLSIGELYLRLYPPADLHPFLGDAAPGQDRYRSDDRLGFVERDFEAFQDTNRERMKAFEPVNEAKPHWAMFGNSFVQMDGMLADTARQARPQLSIFNLGRNEPLNIRIGQIRLLLRAGFRPKRILFAILPVDAIPLVQHPLTTTHANANGVKTYDAPESLGLRLLLAARLRLGDSTPSVNAAGRQLADGLPDSVSQDFESLFDVLAAETRRVNVPVTILLIPNFEQITAGRSHAFQDHLTQLAQSHSLDVCDVRRAFQNQTNLFLPDKHFSPHGNAILHAALLAHLGEGPP